MGVTLNTMTRVNCTCFSHNLFLIDFLGAKIWNKITSFNLNSPDVSDAILFDAATRSGNIVNLTLANSDKITPAGKCLWASRILICEGLAAILKGNKKIKTLDITGCLGLINGADKVIVENAPQLQELGVAGFKDIVNDDWIRYVVSNLPQLKKLDISGNTKLTENFTVGTENWGHLEFLDCSNVANALNDNGCKLIAQSKN